MDGGESMMTTTLYKSAAASEFESLGSVREKLLALRKNTNTRVKRVPKPMSSSTAALDLLDKRGHSRNRSRGFLQNTFL